MISIYNLYCHILNHFILVFTAEEGPARKKSSKKSTAAASAAAAESSQAESTSTFGLTNIGHSADVLDMPVDPNEPTYCLCHQVSYGEMIGCDNPDVLNRCYINLLFTNRYYYSYLFCSVPSSGFTLPALASRRNPKANGFVQSVQPTARKSDTFLNINFF